MSPLITDRKAVTTAGTAEQLPNFPAVKGRPITIKAMDANTSSVSVGRTKALAEGSTSFRLTAGKGLSLNIANASEVWLDAAVSGEGVELLSEI